MSNCPKGFALLIVLWTIGLLSLLGTQIVATGRSDRQLAHNLQQAAMLEAAADGAVANVLFSIQAQPNSNFRADGVQREVWVGSTRVLVQVWKESDRVNLNTASEALLRALIIEVGDEPARAGELSAAIVDWRAPRSNTERGGAKAWRYRSAGLDHGPPELPFQSVDELSGVLGMTPDLFERLNSHVTVLTDNDPDMSTLDTVVARALADAWGMNNDIEENQQVADRMLQQTRALTAASRVARETEPQAAAVGQMLRVKAIAVGEGSARVVIVVVASADFQNMSPNVKIFLREQSVGGATEQTASGAH